jgi:DNA polymerase-4
LDAFYVAVERAREPRLAGRAVVVGGLPGERGVVACASYEARGYGLHAGMPLVEATALLPRRCPRCVEAQSQSPPDLAAGCERCPVFLHGDHAAYMEASQRVLTVLRGFAPEVEPVSLDEAYLDWTGCERHHRSWLEAAQRLRAAVLAATGLSISVGVGGTRAVAAVAAALAKPAGILVVRAGEERAFLSALPLEYLPGVGPKMRATLTRFNLLTVGDLAALPPDLMEGTFGRLGPVLVERARGREDAHTAPERGGLLVGEREPKTRSISRETSFAEDTDDRRVVDGMLSYLAQRAAKALRDEGFVARSVGVRLRYSDFDTVEARRRLPEPTDSDQPILAQVRALWPQRWTRRVRLRLVGVVLHDLVPAVERQLTLSFSPLRSPQGEAPGVSSPLRSPQGEAPGVCSASPGAEAVGEGEPAFARDVPREVDRAVDRIRDRLGFGAVVRGRAIGLLPEPSGGRRQPRGRTGRFARTAAHALRGGSTATPRGGAESAGAPRPGSWSLRGLGLRTPSCSR